MQEQKKIDDNGDLISAYVYGGAMPLMRLDSNGNPVYYLTDAMGSVIGLADGSGVEVADFRYDSFGNLRSSTGIEGDREADAGGDFRFQGQWLESTSDLYHFRARYYDPESGRFVSRDSVDYLEYESESSNLYQFVYNNPYVMSDPSGEFTISEIQTARQIENVLQRTQSFVARQAYDYFVDQAKGVAGNLLYSALNALMPDLWGFNYIDQALTGQGTLLETFIRKQICGFFGGQQGSNSLSSRLWFGSQILTNGNPHENGFDCSNPNGEFFIPQPNIPNPDFIFKKGAVVEKDGNPKAWLIGDIKASLRELHNKVYVTETTQWKAIHNYADLCKRTIYTFDLLYCLATR